MLRSGIAAGLFSCLAFTSAPAKVQQNPAKQERSSSSERKTRQEPTARTTFVLKVISDGMLCPMDNLNCEDKDIFWKNFNLLASDGHSLDLTSIPFPSVERCKKQFNPSIKWAQVILRRGPESSSLGDQVGERALGLFPESKGTKSPLGLPHYKLFWMRGANFWEVTGQHLEEIVALEDILKEQGVNVVWGWH